MSNGRVFFDSPEFSHILLMTFVFFFKFSSGIIFESYCYNRQGQPDGKWWWCLVSSSLGIRPSSPPGLCASPTRESNVGVNTHTNKIQKCPLLVLFGGWGGLLLGSAGDTSRKNTVVWPSSWWQSKPPTTRNGRFFPSVLLLTSNKTPRQQRLILRLLLLLC